jgi:hypothetical protein
MPRKIRTIDPSLNLGLHELGKSGSFRFQLEFSEKTDRANSVELRQISCCQPDASTIASMVAPLGARNIAIIRACLLSECPGCFSGGMLPLNNRGLFTNFEFCSFARDRLSCAVTAHRFTTV